MIKPETLAFLKDIKQNNNRDWFTANKPVYEKAKADVLAFVKELITALSSVDPEFSAETDPKKCLMRIYRDVRFSKNKDPYKINYGISFGVKGKGVNEPGYYLHIEPGKSFIAGGYWMPEAAQLKLIRQEVDYNSQAFLSIINDENFRQRFELSKEDTLKTAPKGYEKDDPNIKLLKLKSFIAIQPLKDEVFFKADIVNNLKTSFTAIYPFILFLRKAIDQ